MSRPSIGISDVGHAVVKEISDHRNLKYSGQVTVKCMITMASGGLVSAKIVSELQPNKPKQIGSE